MWIYYSVPFPARYKRPFFYLKVVQRQNLWKQLKFMGQNIIYMNSTFSTVYILILSKLSNLYLFPTPVSFSPLGSCDVEVFQLVQLDSHLVLYTMANLVTYRVTYDQKVTLTFDHACYHLCSLCSLFHDLCRTCFVEWLVGQTG